MYTRINSKKNVVFYLYDKLLKISNLKYFFKKMFFIPPFSYVSVS